VSYESPVLPDGYTVGEKVYYTGESLICENGDRIEHGARGEVVGPAKKPLKGKGVAVRIFGIEGIKLYPLTVVRSPPSSPLPTFTEPHFHSSVNFAEL